MAWITKLDDGRTLINWNRLGFISFFFLWMRIKLLRLFIGRMSVIANANICGSVVIGNGLAYHCHFQENILKHHRLHDRHYNGRLILPANRWAVFEGCSHD